MNEKSNGRLQKLAYSIGSIADTGSYSIVSSFLLYFLIDVVYLNTWLASLIYMISYGIWNAINDPIVGVLSDRTHTRWGRRKPWIMIGAPLSLIFYILFWGPPAGANEIFIFFYMLIAVAGYEFTYSMAAVPWFAVFPELWQTTKERTSIVIYRQTFALLGGALAVGVFPILQGIFSDLFNELVGWTWAGGFLGALFTLCFLISLFGIKEHKEFVMEKQEPLFQSIKMTLKNITLLTYMGIDLMTWCMFGWMSAMSPFFLTHSLGMELEIVALIMLPNMLATIVFFPVWKKIYIRFGPKRSMLYSTILVILSYIPVIFVTELIGLASWGFVTGIAFSGILVSREVMMGDIVDEDELKTGLRREGSYFGFIVMVEKFSLVLIGLATSILLDVFIGYDPLLPDPPLMDIGIRLGMIGMVTVFSLILLLFLKFYPLNKEKVSQIHEEVKRLHDEKKDRLEKVDTDE
ncbi:MAG: MFS transporter [Candidatus Heimdallarchaeota archaeon]